MKKKKKNKISTTVLLVIIFIIGLSLLLYPSVANYVNELNGSKAIGVYSDAVAKMTAEEYQKMISEAREYNETLVGRTNMYSKTVLQKAEYERLLDSSGRGIMGYIEIPDIKVSLPIYHGTEENTLQVAVGHLDWTSLPVGGESSHCVLSGHRGLPSAKLFTDLDKLAEGDTFIIRVLNEVMTYEVDQILIVTPQDTKDLQIVEGKDYCTLMTCTPYGINSHRLLVRGHRIENIQNADSVRITAELIQVEPLLIAAILSFPLLLLLLLAVFLWKPAKKKNQKVLEEQ